LKLILANAVSFQLVWLATVAGAAKGLWWAGPLAALLFAAWQVPLSAQPRADLKLMLCAAAAGFVVDSALVLTGLLRFETALPWAGFAPVWIVSLWVAFALTLNHSLAGLKHRPLLAVGLGLIGGPLAYGIAASAWKAVELGASSVFVLAVIGLIWALATPLLLALADRLRQPLRAV
jgi:hypothetical protein